MEAITVKDEDVAHYMGRRLKINREELEFVDIVSGWLDVDGKRHWVIEAENGGTHFLPSEGWLIYTMDT